MRSSISAGANEHFLTQTLAVLFGNLATLGALSILYLNYFLFEDYALMLLWATVFAIGLRRAKKFVMRAQDDKHWLVDVGTSLKQRAFFNTFLVVSWIAALCNTFGVLLVVSCHVVVIAGVTGYVTLLERGYTLHTKCCTNQVAGAIVLLGGGFVVVSIAAVVFTLKCTEEGAEAFASISEWANTISTAKDDGGPSALWLQVHDVLQRPDVQDGIEQARTAVGDMLDSLSEVAGEGFVSDVQVCYNKTEGDVPLLLECVWGEEGFDPGMETVTAHCREIDRATKHDIRCVYQGKWGRSCGKISKPSM